MIALIGAFFLSHGTAGGDENLPVRYAIQLWDYGWSAVWRDRSVWLAHRFFWFLEKSTWQILAGLSASLFHQPSLMTRTALLVTDDVLFMLAGVMVMLWDLCRRGFSWPLATLAIATLLFASSGVSFFSGGVIECQMIFYAAVVAAALESRSRRGHWALAAAAACLMFCKSYALLPLGCVVLFHPAIRRRFGALAFLLLLLGVWTLVTRTVGGTQNSAALAENVLGHPTLAGVTINFVRALISFPFGLLWCFPLLAMLAWTPPESRSSLYSKLAGILSLTAALSVFAFWHAAGATAGPRYITPFLVLILPEMAAALSALLPRFRPIALIIPLVSLIFLPCLDYHNGLIYRWAGLPNSDTRWPFADPGMQPAVLAWRVVAAKETQAPVFRPSGKLMVIRTDNIFPMTGISRLVYLSEGSRNGPDALGPRTFLARHGLDDGSVWRILRTMMIAAFLGWLLMAGVAVLAATRHRQSCW